MIFLVFEGEFTFRFSSVSCLRQLLYSHLGESVRSSPWMWKIPLISSSPSVRSEVCDFVLQGGGDLLEAKGELSVLGGRILVQRLDDQVEVLAGVLVELM